MIHADISIVTMWSQLRSADSDLRLARRVQRDTVDRGRDIQYVLDQVSTVDFKIFCITTM